jgi:uncharacterized protein YegL
MSEIDNFTIAAARPLPVIILADISGSMSENGKIAVLNKSIKEMISSLCDAASSRVEIQVAVITFGGETARLHQDLISANKCIWTDMVAGGKTPMGSAFRLAVEFIENKEKIPSRAYTPAIILVSDCKPSKGTEDWHEALNNLIKSERASKAARYALAIGDDADIEMGKAFLDDPSGKVFQAHEASDIQRFFRFVTFSVTSRSQNINPNQVQLKDTDDFDY